MNRIKDDIKQRRFHNLYLLYGSEELLKKITGKILSILFWKTVMR